MIKNVGLTDRNVRLVAAAVLIPVAMFVMSGPLAWVVGLTAVVLAATALIGTCPAYLPFGFSTRG